MRSRKQSETITNLLDSEIKHIRKQIGKLRVTYKTTKKSPRSKKIEKLIITKREREAEYQRELMVLEETKTWIAQLEFILSGASIANDSEEEPDPLIVKDELILSDMEG